MQKNTENNSELSQLTVSQIRDLAEQNKQSPGEFWEQNIEPEIGESSESN